jgi:hypothetical protein
MSQNIHDHIPLGNGTLCGSNSFAAIHRVADCARCVQRLHKVTRGEEESEARTEDV